jgi:hypothetical protein
MDLQTSFIFMTLKEREELVEFIKKNDITYNDNAVDFRYYSDDDLVILKKRLDMELEIKSRGGLPGRALVD